MFWSMYSRSPVPLVPCDTLSVLRGTICGLFANSKSPPCFAPLVFSTLSVVSVIVGGISFLGIFFNQSGLSYGLSFGYVCFPKHLFIPIVGLSRIEVNFKTCIHVCHHSQVWTTFRTFLSVALSELRCIFILERLSSPYYLFFHIAYPFTFSTIFSSFPYSAAKLFYFLVINFWYDFV